MIQWLQSMPAEWGNYVSMLLFCGLAVLVWLIPVNKITKGLAAPKKVARHPPVGNGVNRIAVGYLYPLLSTPKFTPDVHALRRERT